MSECYVNARIVPQAFAWFEPDPDMTASREGGPYGEWTFKLSIASTSSNHSVCILKEPAMLPVNSHQMME